MIVYPRKYNHIPNYNTARSLSLLQQLRQLGDIRRDPPRLIVGEQLDSRAVR